MARSIGKYISAVFLAVLGITFLYPIVWMLLTSFKTSSEVYSRPFGLPEALMWTNYPDALKAFHFLQLFSNSLVYCAGTIILTLAASCMFAYCSARMHWKYANTAVAYVALGLIIPVQVVIIPIFKLLKTLNIRNTFLGLVLPYSAFALASATLMLFAFFRTLPKELEESACVDGCNVYRSFVSIILPMVKPALVTQVVIIFMNSWNEFFMAFILVTKEEKRTLPIGLMNFFLNIGTTQWGQIGAAMVIASVPTILVYVLFSEQIEKALTAGAILK